MSKPAYQLTRLPNGVRIATREMPHMQSACVGVWAGVGARHERAAQGGLSHFLEHMLFKGTKRHSAKQLTQAVEGLGGYLNAFTTEDHTCYYAKASAAHFPKLAAVLADMYGGSVFDPAEIEREREVIREEILMYRDQPAQHVQELLSETMWPGQPLGRPLTGTEETIAHLKRADLLRYWRENYHAGNTIVTVAGRITHAEAVEVLTPLFGGLPQGRAIRCRRAIAPASGPAIRLHSQETGQTHVAMGFSTCGRHDERRYALKLLSVILGENMSSRLFQQLRERAGYCYSVQSSLTILSDTGVLSITAGLDTGKLRNALRTTMRELARICEKAPTRKELQQAQDYTVGQTFMGLESTTNQMMWMGESLLSYRKIQDPVEIENRLMNIKPACIQQAACESLHHAGLGIAVISPMKDAAPLREWLGSERANCG